MNEASAAAVHGCQLRAHCMGAGSSMVSLDTVLADLKGCNFVVTLHTRDNRQQW
jgi:hypothetical protein